MPIACRSIARTITKRVNDVIAIRMAGAKLSTGIGSPFNPSATKKYAGNQGSPATNPKAVSQYDNACAQHALH